MYITPMTSDSSCVKGGLVNPFSFYLGDENNVQIRIKEIDDVPTDWNDPQEHNNNYCMTSGKHQLGVEAFAGSGRLIREYIEVELKPGRRYRLRGNLKSSSITFLLFDITTESQVAAEVEINFKSESKQNIATPIVPSANK